MASAGDRIQIILQARDETQRGIDEARANLRSLKKERDKAQAAGAKGDREAEAAAKRLSAAMVEEQTRLEHLQAARNQQSAKARAAAKMEAQATAAATAKIEDQMVAVRKLSAQMDKFARVVGLQGRNWDRLAGHIVRFRSRATSALSAVHNRLESLNNKFSSLRMPAALTGAVSVAGMGYTAAASIKEYSQAETAQNKLTNAYKKFPKMANMPIASLRKLNAELQMHTRFDDDDTATMQANLGRFGVTGKQIANLTPLIGDLATAQGTDMTTAGANFGKALLGNTRALKSLGINYTSTGNKAKDYRNIVKLLNQQVGGSSKAAEKTSAVQMAILQNQYGELKETIGKALIPVLRRLVKVAGPAIQAFAKSVQDHMPQIRKVIKAVSDGIASVIGFLKKNPEVWKAAAVAVGALTIAMGALAIAVQLTGIPLLVLAIVALIAGLAYLYFKFEAVRKVVNFLAKSIALWFKTVYKIMFWFWGGVFRIIGRVVKWLVKTAWPLIKGFALGVAGFFKGMYASLRQVWDNVVTAIRKAKNKIGNIIQGIKDAVKGIWDGLVSGLSDKIDQVKSFLKSIFPGLSKLPWFFAGGEIAGGTRAVVGEIGPELFIPTIGDPQMIGQHGAEIRTFATSGVIIPNHLVGAMQPTRSGTATMTAPAGPSVTIQNMTVGDEFDVERAMTNAMLRAARIERERR